MTTYKNGNAVDALIDGEVDFLLHVANCRGKMGSGIALEIKNRIPSAYFNYKYHEKINSKVILGEVSSGSNVVNLHAQEYYGYDGKRYLDYEALAKCLEKTKGCLDKVGNEVKIGVPFKMGCDRAGGSWNIVVSMLEHYLQDYKVVVYDINK